MSNALAISAVTAVLQSLFNAVFNQPSSALGSVLVSAVAPDIVQTAIGASSGSQLRVNLFLHQVTPNTSWRNMGLPSLGADGATRLTSPPLALDLHYLLTVYASEDTEAEALLGYAVLMLHENPILARTEIRTALAGLTSTAPLHQVLSSSGLADQIEMIKITPSILGREEMAWLWTALKADYRPTFPFQVSVVLLQPQLPVAASLPVLSRGITSQPSAAPAQLQLQLPAGEQAAAPGDTVTITGTTLTGAGNIALSNQRLGIQYPQFAPATVTPTSLTFTVPNDPANLPAATYDVAVIFTDGSGKVLTIFNALSLAPVILSTPAPTAAANSAGTLVTLGCNPQARPNQKVSLLLGANATPAQPFTTPAATLTFQFTPALASGSYLARLQVDELVSAVGVNWSAVPPVFTGPMVTV
jgi:Pvc16 N-terminal domain